MTPQSLIQQAQARMQTQLDALPENRKGGAWFVVTDEDGERAVRLAVATRIDRATWDLQVGGYVQIEAKHVSEGAELLFTWGGK